MYYVIQYCVRLTGCKLFVLLPHNVSSLEEATDQRRLNNDAHSVPYTSVSLFEYKMVKIYYLGYNMLSLHPLSFHEMIFILVYIVPGQIWKIYSCGYQ